MMMSLIGMTARTFASEFPVQWHADTKIVRDGDQVVVRWSDKAEDEDGFDYLIAATGRRANLDKIGLENTSLRLNKNGIPAYDPQSMRVVSSLIPKSQWPGKATKA